MRIFQERFFYWQVGSRSNKELFPRTRIGHTSMYICQGLKNKKALNMTITALKRTILHISWISRKPETNLRTKASTITIKHKNKEMRFLRGNSKEKKP
jgi:hypothetical protein